MVCRERLGGLLKYYHRPARRLTVPADNGHDHGGAATRCLDVLERADATVARKPSVTRSISDFIRR